MFHFVDIGFDVVQHQHPQKQMKDDADGCQLQFGFIHCRHFRRRGRRRRWSDFHLKGFGARTNMQREI